MKGITSYVKINSLQNPEAKQTFKLDEKLKTLFSKSEKIQGKESIQFNQILGALSSLFPKKVTISKD